MRITPASPLSSALCVPQPDPSMERGRRIGKIWHPEKQKVVTTVRTLAQKESGTAGGGARVEHGLGIIISCLCSLFVYLCVCPVHVCVWISWYQRSRTARLHASRLFAHTLLHPNTTNFLYLSPSAPHAATRGASLHGAALCKLASSCHKTNGTLTAGPAAEPFGGEKQGNTQKRSPRGEGGSIDGTYAL